MIDDRDFYESESESKISCEFVIEVHDTILRKTKVGLSGTNPDKLEGALARIDQQTYYRGVVDVFELAAWYGIAIAKGHAFNDGNKRTGLAVMLVYLDMQGYTIRKGTHLDDMMVQIIETRATDDGKLAIILGAYLSTLVLVDD